MVQFFQEQDYFGDLGKSLGLGAGQGFMNRSDELSLQNVIGKLHPEANYQDVLKAIVGTPTYSPDAKQNAINNLTKSFEKKEKQNQINEQRSLEQASKNTISQLFGDKFAEAWSVSTEGGRTELLRHAIDALERDEDVNNLFNALPQKAPESKSEKEIDSLPQLQNGEIPKDIKWPKFKEKPKGYTPKEWTDRRKEWRKENSPVFDEVKRKFANVRVDELGIKNLTNINEKRTLPEGFERILINPETGDFYGIAEVAGLKNPDVQEWSKEIARFQNRAKDAFGARVTNFDLQSYMRQFPGLLNTYEGRKRILEMMQINNKLDALYESTLKKVYQEYGLDGIPKEKAEEITEHFIEKETEALREKYTDLNAQNQESAAFPSATENKDRIIRSKKTGKRYKSNGTDWVEVANG